jgi:hypothetical protein
VDLHHLLLAGLPAHVCQNSGSRLSFKKSAFEKGLQRLGGVSGRVK